MALPSVTQWGDGSRQAPRLAAVRPRHWSCAPSNMASFAPSPFGGVRWAVSPSRVTPGVIPAVPDRKGIQRRHRTGAVSLSVHEMRCTTDSTRPPQSGSVARRSVGIEAALSQNVRAHGLDRSRYRGLKKPAPKHAHTAPACGDAGVADWINTPCTADRRSSRLGLDPESWTRAMRLVSA